MTVKELRHKLFELEDQDKEIDNSSDWLGEEDTQTKEIIL